jgi:hypothetical protein
MVLGKRNTPPVDASEKDLRGILEDDAGSVGRTMVALHGVSAAERGSEGMGVWSAGGCRITRRIVNGRLDGTE